jgi:hypothetical protein
MAEGKGMMDKVKEAIAKLKQDYPITETSAGGEIELKVEGVQETFRLATFRHECILFADAWHEHFDTADDLAEFLDGLFTGRVQIVVKYRGKTPVAHKVRLLHEGKIHFVSWTGSLISLFLFWRKKSYKTLDYRRADKRLKQTP